MHEINSENANLTSSVSAAICGLEERMTVLRFFCKDSQYRHSSDNTDNLGNVQRSSLPPPPIIESFLYQALDKNRDLFRSISSMIPRFEEDISTHDVGRIFTEVLTDADFGHIILIINGLDECKDEFNRDILGYLDSLVHNVTNGPINSTTCSLRIFISCQAVGSIPIWPCRYHTIHVQLSDIDQDIGTYIQDRIETIARIRHFDEKIKGLAMRMLKERSGRSFLWVSFVILELRQVPEVSFASLENVITKFPDDLDRYYGNILTRITQDSNQADSWGKNLGWILLSIVFSIRDFRVNELAELLAISEIRRSHCDLENYVNKDMASLIHRSLSPLITIEQDHVAVAHYSIYEYLDKIRPLGLQLHGLHVPLDPSRPYGHVLIVERCLRYLLFEDFDRSPPESTRELNSSIANFPFLQYAVTYWPWHSRQAGEKIESLTPLLHRFLNFESGNYVFWERFYFAENGKRHEFKAVSVLCTLVQLDLENVYDCLISYDGEFMRTTYCQGWQRRLLERF